MCCRFVRFIGAFSASSLNNFLGGKLKGAQDMAAVVKPKAGLECPVEVAEPVVEEDDVSRWEWVMSSD